MKCDLCNNTNLTVEYVVKTSLIDSSILSCDRCGLIQSIYKYPENKHTYKSISCDADWGNIRHGKSIRLQNSIDIITKYINKETIKNILDIGSSRGHFINWTLSYYQTTNVHAIESDKNIVNDYDTNPNIKLSIGKIENQNLKNKFYDLIYSSHTLEHVSSPSIFFEKVYNGLKNDGYLYIEVPSIEILKDKNNLEEFFIDKHTYHFSSDSLIQYLKKYNLSIIYLNDDGFNISILAKKSSKINIKKYNTILKNNRKNLKQSIIKFNHKFKNKTLAFYGVGKTLDALIKYGDLKLNNVKFLVDDYICKYINEIHNKKVFDKEILKTKKVDCVILLTKSSSKKIEVFLKENNIEYIHFKEFMIYE